MLENLKKEAGNLGKKSWRAMLVYTAALHEKAILPVRDPFPYPWEEIGPGYMASPAFGHWDIVHQILDSLPVEREHAKAQIINNLTNQQPDGFLPGTIWMKGEKAHWSDKAGHPPVWPVAVHDYYGIYGDATLPETCYEPLLRQIDWFETHRKAESGGFYYTDILNRHWESGVDDGVRFDHAGMGAYPCVDATAHVYQMIKYGELWAKMLGKDHVALNSKKKELEDFIRGELYDEQTGFFYDGWSVHALENRHQALEGMWPVVVGAATEEQANRVIDGQLLNPERFFAAHPLSTVGISDTLFELRMWRGPAWNSMTYWAARGCVQYGRKDAAKRILEKALDATSLQFERTGTIWEFYQPFIGNQMEVQRKPYTDYNTPCRDYLGHNPLLAMARMFDSI